ncbi:MAG: tetratricopeptide repeat protein [Planctomycetota bacterium]
MHSSDRNLLAGIIALQLDLVSNDQLAAAMRSWANDQSQPLERVFVRDSVIDEDTARLIETRVKEQLRLHGESIDRSLNLAATAIGTPLLNNKGISDETGALDSNLQIHPKRESSSSADEETIDTSQDLAASTGLGSLGKLADRVRSAATAETMQTATGDFSRYHVVRPLAKGGLGEVTVALDDELNREVALKTIQGRYADQTECRNRFLVEAEVTGSLEHPGIVPVYGCGKDSFGRPYYAMRLIRGESLGNAIKQHYRDAQREPSDLGLEFRKLIGRFLDVCHAIEYAHSRGILHRDLKPGNIMLGKYGETLVVDWGLAKVLGTTEPETRHEEDTLLPHARDDAHQTMDGTAVGTPMYMSPEQAAGRVSELTARSDIYSLGATLYCLITGKPPFSDLSTKATIACVIDGNLTRPRVVRPSVPKALEAICLQAMAKEPTDRYATASALAEDLERWLADEPVAANRESMVERSGRWLRRHRSIAASALAASLLIAVTSIFAALLVNSYRIAAQDSESKANVDRLAAETAREEALDALAGSEQARDEAKEVSNFLVTTLQSPDPFKRGISITVADVLDHAVEELEDRFADRPLTKAKVAQTIAITYNSLGEYGKARPLLEMALPIQQRLEDHVAVFESLFGLGVAEHHLDENPRKALAYAEQAHRLADEVLDQDDERRLLAMNSLGIYQGNLGRHAQALETFAKLIAAQGEDVSPNHLTHRSQYAEALRDVGRYRDAIAEVKSCYDIGQREWGLESPNTLLFANQLAYYELEHGSPAEALRIAQAAINETKDVFGAEHHRTLSLEGMLIDARRKLGDTEGLVEASQELIRRRTTARGKDHPHTISSKRLLGRVYQSLGRLGESIDIYRDTHQDLVDRLGENHPSSLSALQSLYFHLDRLERTKEANAILVKLIEGWTIADSEDTYQVRRWETILLERLRWLGRFEEVVARGERLIDLQRRIDPPAVAGLAHSLPSFAAGLTRIGRTEDAETVLRQFNQICSSNYQDSWLQADVDCQLGRLALLRGEPEPALKKLIDGFGLLMQDYPSIPASARRGNIVGKWLGQLTRLYGQLNPDLDDAGILDGAATEVRETIGDDHAALAYLAKFAGDRAAAANDLEAAAAYYNQSLENCRKRDEPPDTLEWSVLNQLGLLEIQWSRDPKRALELSKEAWDLAASIRGPFHEFTSTSRNNYLLALANIGRLSEAIRQREKLVDDNERVLGPEHRKTLLSKYNLTTVYQQSGRIEEAIDLLESTLEVRVRVFGERHYGSIRSREMLATLYQQKRRFTEAESLLGRNIEDLMRTRSAEHVDVLRNRYKLLRGQVRQGQFESVHKPLRQLVATYDGTIGPKHHQTVRTKLMLARVDEALGQDFATIEKTIRKLFQDQVDSLGAKHRYTLETLGELASHYRRTDQGEKERQALTELEARWSAVDAPESTKALSARVLVLSSLRWSGQTESILRQAPELIERLSDHPVQRGTLMADYAAALSQADRVDEARETLERGLEVMHDQAVWQRAEARLQLAEILVASGDDQRAEELAISANKGLLKDRHNIHCRRVADELIERSFSCIISLLQRRGADETQAWRAKHLNEQGTAIPTSGGNQNAE